MFTQNYINYMEAIFMADGNATDRYTFIATDNTSQSSYRTNFIAPGFGGNMKFGKCRDYVYGERSSEKATYPGVYFGEGATPATKENTRLESLISSGLTITNPVAVVKRSDGAGRYEYRSDFVVRNDTETEVNIRETGLFMPFSTGSSSHYQVLVERTVLETPVTIPAGEARLIEYKVTFNQS